MKKFTLLGCLAAMIIAGVFLLGHHARMVKAGDETFRQRLAGVWVREELNLPPGEGMPLDMRCTNTVAADGSFVERSWFSHSDRTNTYQRTGTWQVNHGHLIQTIKSSTNPTEVTPWTDAARIVRADASGFTLRWPKADEPWQRVTQ